MENFENLMEETISFGPIEMAQEINVQLATSATIKKDQTRIIILIVVGLIIAGGITYMIVKPQKTSGPINNDKPAEN